MNTKIKWPAYLVLTALIFAAKCQALSSDRDQTATFTSENANFNCKTGVMIFYGAVKMDQGTTHLTGDQVTVYKINGKIVKIVAVGKQAHYNTLPDNQKEPIDALADSIEYYPPKSTAILIGNAVITQGSNSFHGPHVVYNMQQQTILAAAPDHKTRSVIMLQPQDLPGQTKS